MNTTVKIWITSILILVLALTFLLIGSGLDFDYLIPKRLLRLTTIVLGSICLAFSAILFQTIVGNRILAPSVMGYEAVYLLWQVLLLSILGAHGLAMLSVNGNFLISIALMLVYSWALHYWLLPRCKNDVYMLLLFGLVLTMVLGTATQYIQLSISPGEFSIFQGLSYTSFNRSNPETLLYGVLTVAVVLWIGRKTLPVLDVLSLGREQSMSLGVNHPQYVRLYLALIAILVAVSTSLIGPTAFMGVFIANIAYALAGSNKHKVILPIGCAVSIIIFLVAQLFVEHVFNYKTSVSILVNLVCGIYFLTLIARTRGTS
ncbi:iron chelate uptake ABC transporter family permease subunit [Marinomonas transparens]|uniref:Iron chelate uptake ABC transporter family permease subunit n=1 Tax=Marinomonas transparens TaxID=2795388 RepID=A0A934JN80_9GAMM|nr:iron chelate uptake ABC transporter family permease subunit [Marinomonas transparens]MBJ7539340.1 iron chelate uptake ABC transporter family permease subunit [Marinomonas transparens]